MQLKKTNETFENANKDKLRRMLSIKQSYMDGELSTDQAKERMQNEVGKISPEEFAAAEQLLQDEDPDECKNEDVRTMLDIFEGLISETDSNLPYGHPIDAYRRENKKMESLLNEGDELTKKPFVYNPWIVLMEQVLQYKIHFSRKQNQLYSVLERKGFDRPSTTMWTYDDYIRDEMNEAMQLLKENKYEAFLKAYKTVAVDLRDLMSKEELILYPTSLKLIAEEEFEEMKSGDREIGFFLIDMPEHKKPKNIDSNLQHNSGFMGELSELLSKYGFVQPMDEKTKALDVAEGKLTLEQINLLYRHLPVDISFVDENDLVAFYTDTTHRVFPRSKEVIGREVKNCHPPKSVHLVQEIIDKFRGGEQDKAEFWINKPDIFIYIIYVAVRDEQGKFRGVMEMMQDCTHIRKLEGSRTLLTWDEERKDQDVNGEEHEVKNTTEESNEELTAKTKLKDLLKRHPELLDDIIAINPKFQMLKTPMAKIILPIATIKMMSERSEMPLDTLLEKLNELIKGY